jgi:Domain of unknown function (DUF5060)/Domain of unknown function (DUF5605)/Protein of unknown function (DUF4038)
MCGGWICRVVMVVACCAGLRVVRAQEADAGRRVVERWGIAEVVLKGPAEGNPFVEVTVSAKFTQGEKVVEVAGFYDGEGVYRIRFEPGEVGEWKYVTKSNRGELDGRSGAVTVTAATGNNHGPVGVRHVFHFGYADGSVYVPIGTTCYYWAMQPEAVEDETVATLKGAPFNKIRMFVMPAADAFGAGVTGIYPFEGKPAKNWDFTRFNPAFFRGIERRVEQLRDLGIEADLILFNPYDKGKWGYDNMGAGNDERYARYVVARLGAYRNVWWSLSNEFDLMKTKTDADWDRLFQVVAASDPYGHLRSIHHSMRLYDYGKAWVTHASLQNGSAVEDFGRAELYRDVYNKPIVLDEVKYEGDLVQRWGHLTGEEMVARFWQGTIAGTYVGHSESFNNPGGTVWMNQGGVLKGQSAARIGFLKGIVASAGERDIDPIDKWQDVRTAGKAGEFYLVYFGEEKPTSWKFELPKAGLKEGMRFKVEVVDTWGMTVSPVEGEFVISAEGKYRYEAHEGREVVLPGRRGMAVRIVRAPGGMTNDE